MSNSLTLNERFERMISNENGKSEQILLKEFKKEIGFYVWDNKEDISKFTYDDYRYEIGDPIIDFQELKLNVDYGDVDIKLRESLKRACPGAAIDLYVKAYLFNGGVRTKEKYFLSVLDVDPRWAGAYDYLGDIYYDKKKWARAAEYYNAAINLSDSLKTDEMYNCLGLCYSENKDYVNAEISYKECLKINSDYQYTNNNLGLCLQKLKRYDEALNYYDISIELATDSFYPYRNKFDTLLKKGKELEAIELSTSNPKHFNTKYLREKIVKMAKKNNIVNIDSKFPTNTETTVDYAGEIKVSDSKSGIRLYEHQKDAIRKLDKELLANNDCAGLLVLPTGGGKTLTATYWLMKSMLDKGKKVIWLAHRHELLNQAKKSFEKVCYKDITHNKSTYKLRVISGQHDKPVHIKDSDDIIIASKSSLYRGRRHLESWLNVNRENTLLVIDEAHHSTAKEYRELIKYIKSKTVNFKMLGLTATPFRTAENEKGLLKKIFPDDIIYKIDLRELINLGILSEPIFEPVSTEIDMVRLMKSNDGEAVLDKISKDKFFDLDNIGKDIAKAIAEYRERNNIIVNRYVDNKGKYGKTLVFALNIDMAIALNALFKEKGIRSEYIVSSVKDAVTGVTISSEENAGKIQSFRDNKLDVLVNVNILTEGTDLPEVKTIFLARQTKSTILMTQMIGRGLRGEKAGGTKEAYIVSFVDDWNNRIAWVNPEELFINKNVDFTDVTRENHERMMRLVSIRKIEEFARIIDGTIDERLENIDFIERIPVGIYKFSYLHDGTSDDEEEKVCNILVYDCMKEAYEEFLKWIQTENLEDVKGIAEHAHMSNFNSLGMLLGYDKQDLVDLIMFYKETEEVPNMIMLSERDSYDVKHLAKEIIDNEMGPSAISVFINSEWDKNKEHWSAFFGVDNLKVFIKLINDNVVRLANPGEYLEIKSEPITKKEKTKIKNLPLYEMIEKYPEIGEKLRKSIYAKYTDEEGYYFSALSGYRSKRKLDFQIDHINPMENGGLTSFENLQLLTRKENARKGSRYSN